MEHELLWGSYFTDCSTWAYGRGTPVSGQPPLGLQHVWASPMPACIFSREAASRTTTGYGYHYDKRIQQSALRSLPNENHSCSRCDHG